MEARIKFIDTEDCIFSYDGVDYFLLYTQKEIKEELTSGYVEVGINPFFSDLREKEIDDVTVEEVEDFVMSLKGKWEVCGE